MKRTIKGKASSNGNTIKSLSITVNIEMDGLTSNEVKIYTEDIKNQVHLLMRNQRFNVSEIKIS